MIKKLIRGVMPQNSEQRRANLYRNLIRREAKIGGEIFGPVARGGRREFFCLDERTWIWHEEWTDESGQHRSRTTRYDIRPDGIVKAQDGFAYQWVTPKEALHLYQAVRNYQQRVGNELYSFAY